MNRSLFISWNALAALLVSGAFVAWLVQGGYAPGSGGGHDRDYLIWSGWVALALFLIVMAYVLRKYVHKLGISPEFAMKVPIAKLERAEARLGELRREITVGRLTDPGAARSRALAALRGEGVHRILRVVVRKSAAPNGLPIILETEPREPLAPMARWLRAHLYFGLAAAVLVWLHGGGSLDSPMAVLLNGLSALVIVTGIVGIVLWAFGPAWLTKNERDLSIEKTYALEQSLRAKVKAALELVDPELKPLFDDLQKGQGDFHERAKAALASLSARPQGAAEFTDLLALLGQSHEVGRELASLWRIKMALNVWRVAHIPAATVLMVLVGLHVFSVLWY
ncbi:MAG: hypothetical protein L0Z55_11735 [Planctomycetes bacterium]|nr:hypothetical protein [Planctomycetota bacterium]